VLLQRAGLRTACLDAKRYAGGMASTVELFDGYRFEIAGSVQFPTSSAVSSELGLDSLPTVDLEVMSVALRGVGDDPVVQFTDPTKMLTHLHRVNGADAVTGMAGLLAWSQAPTRALGRFEAGTLPKSFDEMYACATNEFERSAIDDMLFGSVTDVLDRHFPDREQHGGDIAAVAALASDTNPAPQLQNLPGAVRHRSSIANPAVRRGWLQHGPGPSSARGAEEFVEVSWDELI
ncbi:hypothetical protein M5Z44_10950, partial [Neisseria meningitidis]|nr:hypothetical protein [Neisseria meningitidis]